MDKQPRPGSKGAIRTRVIIDRTTSNGDGGGSGMGGAGQGREPGASVQQSNRRECAKLERRHRRLHALLQWPATCSGAALLCSEMGDPFSEALGDTAALVDSYKGSTLWRRIRSGGAIAAQLRDMQDVVDSYCGLLLFVNAHLLLLQQHHPSSSATSTTTTTTVHEANDMSQSPSAQAVTGTQRANDIGQGGLGVDADPDTGCERNVPDLLPIVISLA